MKFELLVIKAIKLVSATLSLQRLTVDKEDITTTTCALNTLNADSVNHIIRLVKPVLSGKTQKQGMCT